MNVNLNSSLYVRPNNVSKEKGIALKKEGSFSDVITASLKGTKTDQYTGALSSAKTGERPGLKDEDYKYLSRTWNPNKMYQDDFDQLLDYLQDKGIITEGDKEIVGYKDRMRVNLDSTYSPLEPVNDFEDGNLLAYTRYQGSVIVDSNATEGKYKANLFKTITGVLEEMLIRRGQN